MSEDLTRNLPPPSFEERVLNELAAIRQEISPQGVRLTTLEEGMISLKDKVDAWAARDATNPGRRAATPDGDGTGHQ